jgi:NAD(P)-dependent dehydrogenase (short-subunit alcohol dehydrogenase family)
LFPLSEGLGGDGPGQTVASLQRLRTRALDPGLGIVFLASDEASMIQGAVLPIDGGRLAA